MPISLHRDLLPWVPQLLKSLIRGAFTSHTEIFHTTVCLSSVSTSGGSLTSFQTSLLAYLFDLWWDQLPAALELFPEAQRRCPANLPLVTNPCHYTLRAVTAYALCLSDLNRGCKSTSLQESSECFTSLAWSLQEHRGVCTCKTSKHWLSWVWWHYKRIFVLRAVLLTPVFIWACYSDRISIYFSVFWFSSWSRSDSPWGRI